MTTWKYVLSEPDLDQSDIAAVVDCLESGWLSTGPRVRTFEDAFATMHGVRHAIAVSSGTAALHLALAALDIGASPDDEVIQPSLTFVAGANMTRALGAKPVFADIISFDEPIIDPQQIEKRITANTRAVMVMHYGGYPARMDEITQICSAKGIAVIEDACHAPGMQVAGFEDKHLGTLGDIGCFSFFSNKNLTCGEGGMVVTDNDLLAEKLRAMRSHGMTTLSWERHKGRASSYDVTCHGFNYRMDDLRAALATTQLAKLREANTRRQAIARAYAKAVVTYGNGEMSFAFADAPESGTGHIAAVTVSGDVRDHVRAELTAKGIQNSLHYPPVHSFTAFAADNACVELPVTSAFADQVITLPIYPGLADGAPDDIICTIAEIVNQQRLGIAV